MLRLIDQIIDLRKIDLNKMELKLNLGDIVKYIKELTDSFYYIAQQRSMALEFTSEVEAYDTWFDEGKLEKIMYNLLSNAFKFTPDKGKIQIICRLLTNEGRSMLQQQGKIPGPGYFEITVKDNGIGIPEEQKGHLFESYRQRRGGKLLFVFYSIL